MGEQPEPANNSSEPTLEEQATPTSPEQAAPAKEQEAPVADLSADMIALQAQLSSTRTHIKSLEDEQLRLQADMQNTQRRARQDVEKAHKFALEKFATALLDVVDNLERALENADANDAMHQGVTMTLEALLEVLRKQGVTAVNPIKQTFDPAFHQAVAMLEHAELTANTVMEVLQKGYLLNERLIRPAMVTVSTGKTGATS